MNQLVRVKKHKLRNKARKCAVVNVKKTSVEPVTYLNTIDWELVEKLYLPLFMKNTYSRFIVESSVSLLEKRLLKFKNYYDFRFAGKLKLIIQFLLNTEYVNFIQKIYLFGSYAYGHPHPDSDMDFCAIIDNDKSWLDISCSMTKSFWDELIFPVSLLVFTEEQFYKRINVLSIEKVIYEHGILVYENK